MIGEGWGWRGSTFITGPRVPQRHQGDRRDMLRFCLEILRSRIDKGLEAALWPVAEFK